MQTHVLSTEVREQTGKSAARQLRMRDRVPGIFYGPGLTPKGVSVLPKELIAALSTEFGRNSVMKLKMQYGTHSPVEITATRSS